MKTRPRPRPPSLPPCPVKKATVQELAAMRDEQWHLSIHGGLTPSVRAKARKEYLRLQKQIERMTAARLTRLRKQKGGRK